MKNLFFALRYSLKSLRGNISRVVSITLGLALGLLAFSFIVFDCRTILSCRIKSASINFGYTTMLTD